MNTLSQHQHANIVHRDLARIIGTPRITEKAALATSHNVYTFHVALSANKAEIKKAIQALYKVIPVKVNIIRQRATAQTFRGRPGMAKAYKKAIVYLRSGDTIAL